MPKRKPIHQPRPYQAENCKVRALVVVDSTKKRQSERQKYERRCRDLDKATKRLRAFEDSDVPAFTQWLESEFGTMIAACRGGEARIIELNQLIETVRQYAHIHRLSFHVAYMTVKAAKAEGTELRMWDENDEEENVAAEDNEEFNEFNDFFAEFIEFMTGEPVGNRHHDRGNSEDRDFGRGRTWQDASSKTHIRSEDRTSTDYLKSIYRKLVRLLHPDTNPNLTPLQQALWHEVQEGYAWCDVQRLERLLSVVTADGTKSMDLEAIPISHIMDLRRDVERRLRALKHKLTWARREISFDFAAIKADNQRLEKLRYHIAEDLAIDIERVDFERKRLERQIEAWEKPPSPKKSGPRRKAAKSGRMHPMEKELFPDWMFDV